MAQREYIWDDDGNVTTKNHRSIFRALEKLVGAKHGEKPLTQLVWDDEDNLNGDPAYFACRGCLTLVRVLDNEQAYTTHKLLCPRLQ